MVHTAAMLLSCNQAVTFDLTSDTSVDALNPDNCTVVTLGGLHTWSCLMVSGKAESGPPARFL